MSNLSEVRRIRRIDRVAGQILKQIEDMQTFGYYHGSVDKGLLPQVRCFSELHNYFDANVGWGDEWEELACDSTSDANKVIDIVDRTLRDRAGVGPTYAIADPFGLRVEDPLHGHSILSSEGDGEYFDLLAQCNVDVETAADTILTQRGRTRISDWQIVIDDGLVHTPAHPTYRAVVN